VVTHYGCKKPWNPCQRSKSASKDRYAIDRATPLLAREEQPPNHLPDLLSRLPAKQSAGVVKSAVTYGTNARLFAMRWPQLQGSR